MYRLISKAQADRIGELLQNELEEAEKVLRGKIDWRELPERKPSRVYAVDGSQGKQRLSGTIIYTVSSFAFGNGPSARMIYTNAMLYNQGISDQIIRLQMETLENKIGALVGDDHMILMDGTLTGSLTRPPVYPESVRGITTITETLGGDKLEELVDDFVEKLEEQHEKLSRLLAEGRELREGIILADEALDEYAEYYRAMEGKPVTNYDGVLRRLREAVKGGNPQIALMEIVEKLEEYGEEKELSLEDARNSIHVVLGYIEYLHSLEMLLRKDLIYIAKSFYNRKITERLGIKAVDVPFLDAYLRSTYGEEKAGYYVITQGGKPISHRIPKALRKHFPLVDRYISRGVSMAYIRTMRGGIIYLLQSNRRIDDELLAKLLWHESNGYIRPLQRAHEGVKIEQKLFKTELEALLNHLRRRNPELRVFLKYGRSPLE